MVAPPAVQVGPWVLTDYTIGQVLIVGSERRRCSPASLTKLMIGYVVDRAIDDHRITSDGIVTVGKDAWAEGNPVLGGSSLIFLELGDRVSVRNLSRRLIVDSGNDAYVTLAGYVADGQPQFIALMNQYVGKLHLQDAHLETVHGPGAPGQHSSAYNLAVLSWAIIRSEPSVCHMYNQKSLTWNGITQQNRNGLLWDKTMNVDGLKTGHASGAGFNLIASAVDGQRRLIAVVMGADGSKDHEQQTAKLLHWGRQNFNAVQVLQEGQKVDAEHTWYGDREQIKFGTNQDSWLALPKAKVSRIKAKYVLDRKDPEAPIAASRWIGEISLRDGDKMVGHYLLITLGGINKGGVFSRMSDYLHRELQPW